MILSRAVSAAAGAAGRNRLYFLGYHQMTGPEDESAAAGRS